MRGMQFWMMSLASLTLAAVLGSCGKVAEGDGIQLDSNTNWLKRCEADSECSGALVCLCGQCTQPCAETPECGRLEGASCGAANGGACEGSPGAGGLCVLECSSASDCENDEFSCSEGQCVPLPTEEPNGAGGLPPEGDAPLPLLTCPAGGEAMNMDDVFTTITYDLAGGDADDLLSYRYLTLANRRNAGLCGPDLEVERAAMVKVLNSVSLSALVELPFAVDALGLVYRIDLRDYGWDRPVTVNGTRYNDVWEALVDNDVYSVPWQGDDADDVVADTGTAFPVMFASAFVPVATEASMYYALLNIPENVEQLFSIFAINVAQNLIDDELIRAGFAGTDMGRPDDAFIAERHDIEVRSGYLWQVSSFGTPSDLFANPLGQPAGEREIIFTLENGLFAFVFADEDGNRLDTSVAFSASNSPLAVRNSFGRHASGIRVSDQVRGAAELGMLPHLTVGELEKLRIIYPEADDLRGILDNDRNRYAQALRAARWVSRAASFELDVEGTEPISRTYATYLDDVDLNVAAGDLMITPEQLQNDLFELEPEMQVLENGRMSRDEFARAYRDSLCVLSVALENAPDAELCDALEPAP